MDDYQVLVVGGGNAGVSLAARLLRKGFSGVGLVSPEAVHRYRPLLNYVGAGEASMDDLDRPMADVLPRGCTWLQDEVVRVDAAASTVTTAGGRTLRWRTLVLCPGMVEDWEATPGLRQAYAAGWAASTYVTDAAARVWAAVQQVRAGTVVFTVPPEPAPCAPTALKPLLMACDLWQRAGVLSELDVRLVLPTMAVTGVPRADAELERAFARFGVEVLREARVTSVDAANRSITVLAPSGPQQIGPVAFAHAVPHYRAPAWIADSGLAGEGPGALVDVDPTTLRHRRHPAVWAIGDAATLDTRSSGGALRHQVKVLTKNLEAAQQGRALDEYDGYTVMPVTVDRRALLIAEVDRSGRELRSARLLGLARSRRATWLLDRYVLPQVYWHRILRGRV